MRTEFYSTEIVYINMLRPTLYYVIHLVVLLFLTPVLTGDLNWSLSDIKYPQVSRTLLCIRDDFNNAVVCVILILPPIFNSSSVFCKLLGSVQRSSTTPSPTCFKVFSALWQDPGNYLSYRFLLFLLYASLISKLYRVISSFLNTWSWFLVGIRWFISILKSLRIYGVFF